MTSDRTEQQSTDDQKKSRDLSLESVRPPARVDGYEIKKFLGRGAYGEVWSAISQKTGRKVAIKFYTGRSSSDVQMLAREVEKLAVIGADRYVVQLLDIGWDSEPPYYVMDYIEHGSLEDRLKENSTIDTAEAVELFQEIATGMMHLHDKGILHCDLKPGNVLLDQDGKPRVADFGQSRLSSDNTPALGTLFYMAPEQADTQANPDARWDVYGLGALLYSMLAGQPPYYCPELAKEIESTGELSGRLDRYRNALMGAELPFDHRKAPGVDRSLADIIDRCIAVNRNKRYASIQSVLFALRQREEARARRPLMLLGLIGPLLLMGVITLFGWWAIRQAVSDARAGITERSVIGAEFAAQLGARSAAARFDRYFQVVDQLARDEDFLIDFRKVDESPDLLPLRLAVSDPRKNADTITNEFRRRLIDDPVREKLQDYVRDRLDDKEGLYPQTASWFLCDRFGNQIASAFPRGKENTTLCKNFAYRTYFTGLVKDLGLAEVPEDSETRSIVPAQHISTVFTSKQNNALKIAFSHPIVIDGEICGIVACTVELGNLTEFAELPQYAMLVDNRNSADGARVLEHPLFKELLRSGHDLPVLQVSIPGGRLIDPNFLDPVGEYPGGERFSVEQLAAVAPVVIREERDPLRSVSLPPNSESQDEDEQREPSGLYVIAAENKESILKPVHDLSRSLGWIALAALSLLLAVAVTMWILVNRMMRESRERLSRAFAPSNESSALENMETIAAPQMNPGTMTHRDDD